MHGSESLRGVRRGQRSQRLQLRSREVSVWSMKRRKREYLSGVSLAACSVCLALLVDGNLGYNNN